MNDYSDPQVRLDDYFSTFFLMRDKKDILQNIAQDIKQVEEGKVKEGHTESFWKQYLNLMKRFQQEIENAILFMELEDYWCYSYEISELGAKLNLEYISDVDYDDFDEDGEPTSVSTVAAQSFELVTVRSMLLSVEEYAAVYNVSATTVRQWIRRGKIRSAIKNGREWSIPELAEVSGRGYQSGSYFWNCHLNDLPEEFAFLAESRGVTICQDEENKDIYNIFVWPLTLGSDKKIQMPISDKERLELMLISHPLVKADIKPIIARG